MLSDPAVAANRNEFQRIAKEYSDLRELVETYREYQRVSSQIEEDQKLLREDDEDLKELLKEELPQLKERQEELEKSLKILLLPRDPNDERNVFLEIRAGTGATGRGPSATAVQLAHEQASSTRGSHFPGSGSRCSR